MSGADADTITQCELYTLSPSSQAYAITAHFHTEKAFEFVSSLLKEKYVFQRNKNGNGIETHFTESDKNVVISIYENKTVFIQGKGCWQWEKNTFLNMLQQLQDSSLTNESSTPSRASNSSSPIRFLSQIVNSIRNSRKKSQDVDKTVRCSSRNSEHNDSSDSITLVKRLYGTSSSESIVSTKLDLDPLTEPSSEDDTSPKTLFTDVLSAECGDNDNDCSINVCEQPQPNTEINSNNNSNNHLEKFDEDNAQLTEQKLSCGNNEDDQSENAIDGRLKSEISELLSETNKLKLENERLIECIENIKQVNTDLKTKVTEQERNLDEINTKVLSIQSELSKATNANKCLKEENKQLISENAKLRDDNSKLQKQLCQEKSKTSGKATAEILVLQEENVKLKKSIEVISKEKSTLVGKLMDVNSKTDIVETKIENEVSELRAAIFKELDDIKSQIQRSMLHNEEKTSSPPSINKKSKSSKETGIHEEKPVQSEGNSNIPMSVFIAGDSITKILSAGKMSDSRVKTKIKSHPGGRVRRIENTIIKESDQDHIREARAIVLHVGTNNVADGDTSESILEDFKDTIDTIRNVNPGVKVIISSILPRTSDKLVNKQIRATNAALEELCSEKDLYFVNHDDVFIKDNKTDESLYKDHIHLNAKGGRALGTSIRQKINGIFGLPNSVTPDNFLSGRSRERIRTDRQPTDSPMSTVHRPRQNQPFGPPNPTVQVQSHLQGQSFGLPIPTVRSQRPVQWMTPWDMMNPYQQWA